MLQVEIENLKSLRQNYGKDWLLSTSNINKNENESQQLNDTTQYETKKKI